MSPDRIAGTPKLASRFVIPPGIGLLVLVVATAVNENGAPSELRQKPQRSSVREIIVFVFIDSLSEGFRRTRAC